MAKYRLTNMVMIPVEIEIEASDLGDLMNQLDSYRLTDQEIIDCVGLDNGVDENWQITDEEGNDYESIELARKLVK
jgi:hypothetical protein